MKDRPVPAMLLWLLCSCASCQWLTGHDHVARGQIDLEAVRRVLESDTGLEWKLDAGRLETPNRLPGPGAGDEYLYCLCINPELSDGAQQALESLESGHRALNAIAANQRFLLLGVPGSAPKAMTDRIIASLRLREVWPPQTWYEYAKRRYECIWKSPFMVGSDNGKVADGLQAELRASKPAYKLGEDITFTLALRNVSGEALSVLEHRDKAYGRALSTNFVLEAPDGEKMILRDPVRSVESEASSPSSRELQPQGAYEWNTALNLWQTGNAPLRSYAFLPGTYRVYAHYSPRTQRADVWRGAILSNVVEFVVTKEVAPGDPHNLSWGEPGGGIRCGLIMDKRVYGRDEKITGELIVESTVVTDPTNGEGVQISNNVAVCHMTGPYLTLPLLHTDVSTLPLARGRQLRVPLDLTPFIHQTLGYSGPATYEFYIAVHVPLKPEGSSGAKSQRVHILVVDSLPGMKTLPADVADSN